jgi:hypothetical protein
MSKVKLELTRGTVISKGVHGVIGEVVEVESDIARNLRQAGAAKLAAEDAKVGVPNSESSDENSADKKTTTTAKK